MVDALIAGAVVLLLIAGFWWTRGAGGLPGGVDDPARQKVVERFDQTGGAMSGLMDDGDSGDGHEPD